MKEIKLLFLLIPILLFSSCEKERLLPTQIYGSLIVNGSGDKLEIAADEEKPIVVLYQYFSDGHYLSGGSWKEIARTEVDSKAFYSFDLELKQGEDYYLAYFGLDRSKYFCTDDTNFWWTPDPFFPVKAGEKKLINLNVQAWSWVIPRFVNTHNSPEDDVLYYLGGIGPDENSIVTDSMALLQFDEVTGQATIDAPWIHKTWSGTYKYGKQNESYTHKVFLKIKRGNIVRDTVIQYSVEPFDTSVVSIFY